MAERPNYSNNSETLVVEANLFDFETIEQMNGHATVVRFPLKNPDVKAGDVLLVLSGGDIHFHGMIGIISEDGSAVATDRRGSLLPAPTVQ
ncbi:MAG: hypothetical protein LC742_10845 [Acidobacteria bacterium]|nr:hypothetical protein [Acidobacteriota bacterium]